MKQMSTRGQNLIADWQLQIQNEAVKKFGYESPSIEAVNDTLDSLRKVKNSKTHIHLLEKLFHAILQESENKSEVSQRFQRRIDQIVSEVPDASSEDFEPSEATIESESVVDAQEDRSKTSKLVPEVEDIESEFVVEDGSSSNKKRTSKTKQERQQKLNAAFRLTNSTQNVKMVRKLLEEYIKLDCRPLSKKNLSHSSFANMKKLWNDIKSDSSFCRAKENTSEVRRKTRQMQRVIKQHQPVKTKTRSASKTLQPSVKTTTTSANQMTEIESLKSPLQLRKFIQERFEANRSRMRALELWSMFFTKNGKSKTAISNKISSDDKRLFKSASQIAKTQLVAKKIFQLEGLDTMSMPSLKLNSTDKLLSVSNQIASGKPLADVIKQSVQPNHVPYEQQKQDIVNSLQVAENMSRQIQEQFQLTPAQNMFFESYQKKLEEIQLQASQSTDDEVDVRVNQLMLQNQTQFSFDQRLKQLEKIIEKSDSHEELRAQLQRVVLVKKYFEELQASVPLETNVDDFLKRKFTISESAPNFAITDFLNYVYNELEGEVPRQINPALYEQFKESFFSLPELIVWLQPPSEQEAAAFQSLFPDILPQGFDFNKKLLSSQQRKIIVKNTENSRKDVIESQIRTLEQLKSARKMVIGDHSKISDFCRHKNLDDMQQVQQALDFILSQRFPDFGFNRYAVESLHKAETFLHATQQNKLTQMYLQREKDKFKNLSQSTLATAKDFFVDIRNFPKGLRDDFDEDRKKFQQEQQKVSILKEKLQNSALAIENRKQMEEELELLKQRSSDTEANVMQSYLRLQKETETEEQKLLAQSQAVAATQVGILNQLTNSSQTMARRTTEAEIALEALIFTQKSVESVYAPLSSKAMNLVLNVSTFAKNYASDFFSGVRYAPSWQQSILPTVKILDKTNSLRRVLSMPNVGSALTTPRDTDRCNYFRFEQDRVTRAASDRNLVQANRESFFRTLSLPVLRSSNIDFSAIEAMKKIRPDSIFSFASYVCVDCEEMMKFIVRHFLKLMRVAEPDSAWNIERYRSVCGKLMQSIEKGNSPAIPNPFYVGGKKSVYAGVEMVGAWKDVPVFSPSDVKYCITWWLEFDSLRSYLLEHPVDFQTRQQLAELSEKMGLSEFDIENIPLKQTRIFSQLIGTASLIYAITNNSDNIQERSIETFRKLISIVAARQSTPLASYALIVTNAYRQIASVETPASENMLFDVTGRIYTASKVNEIVSSITEFLFFTFDMKQQMSEGSWSTTIWNSLKDGFSFVGSFFKSENDTFATMNASQYFRLDQILRRLIMHVLSVVAPGLAVIYNQKIHKENQAFNIAFGVGGLSLAAGLFAAGPAGVGKGAAFAFKSLIGFSVSQPFTNSEIGSTLTQLMVNNAEMMSKKRMASFATNLGLQGANAFSKNQFSRVNQADVATQNLLEHIKDLKSKGVQLSEYLRDADNMDSTKLAYILSAGTVYYLLNYYAGDIFDPGKDDNLLKIGKGDYSQVTNRNLVNRRSLRRFAFFSAKFQIRPRKRKMVR